MTDIVKSDWIFRLSAFTRKWKREWFVLYLHGELRYYSSKESSQPEGIIHMRMDCTNIATGPQCGGTAEPATPEHMSTDSLFRLDFRDGKQMLMCADSIDDMRAWQFALEQARRVVMRGEGSGQQQQQQHYYPAAPTQPPQQQPPVQMTAVTADGRQVPVYMTPGPGGPMPPPNSHIYYGPYDGRPVYVPPGHERVIYVDDRRCRRGFGYGGYGGYGLGTGLLAGAAMGGMMWGPWWGCGMGPLWW